MMTSSHNPEGTRRRILAMKPEDRALLAQLMLEQHEKTVRDIALLQARQADTLEWLAEFAPDMVPPPAGDTVGSFRLTAAQGAAEYDQPPCQPIGCDNGIHLPGCMWAEVDGGDSRG